jgi:thiamine biosynthesis lipoprotein
MRQVQQIMGMPISIDIPKCHDSSVFEQVFTRFHKIDRQFSTYRPDSEVSRYVNGEIKEPNLSKELKFVIKACRQAEKMTNGYFSAWYSCKFDPSGYVKGWAIAEAGCVIEKFAYKTYCIGAGGDILASSDSDKAWNIGIQDPKDSSKIINKLSISNGAVATSGNYQRGSHIINPKTAKPAEDFSSVTVTGPDIITADILATAIFAMGKDGETLLKNHQYYQAIVLK